MASTRAVGQMGRSGAHLRGLYLVPERRVARRRHLPAGRTLHLVDIENLVGGPTGALLGLAAAVARYQREAPVNVGDHVVIAANPGMALEVGTAWPTARLLAAPGKDGADLALLGEVADVVNVAERYDRVVIGSGDGIFADAAEQLRVLGLAVGVVAPFNGLSPRLYRRASFVRLMTPTPNLQIVA